VKNTGFIKAGKLYMKPMLAVYAKYYLVIASQCIDSQNLTQLTMLNICIMKNYYIKQKPRAFTSLFNSPQHFVALKYAQMLS